MKRCKCVDCGAEMLTTYTREGLRFEICPHTRISVKTITGALKYGEIFCRTANVKGLHASFESLIAHRALDQLRQATKQTIDDGTLLENANLALMLGLPANELAALFGSAMQLGLATGVTPQKAIEALCKGVGRRSRLILDNIGIAFKAKEAYEWFASEHNLEKLDETQKTEAWRAYALKMIKEKARELQ